jgi:hypothetical protein
MWIDGQRSLEPIVDVNKALKRELKGELTEEQARISLGRFLTHNIGFLVRIMTGFILEPYQRIMIKGWLAKNFSLTVAGRGFSKSFAASHFCYLYCLFNPGKHIIVVANNFRSSRKIVENIDDWSLRKDASGKIVGALLRQTMNGDMIKKPDMYKIKFKNGATITALPLGDPNRLRGFRANAVIIDEGLLIPQPTIDNVLKPFLMAPSPDEVTFKQKVREREDKLIKEGKMTEEERRQFKSHAKMIILSSASYSWESLFELYKKYLAIIYRQDDDAQKWINADDDSKPETIGDATASYLVHQISWKAARPDLVEASVREEIESGMFSESTILREYCAQFVQDSDGFFRAAKMEDCTVKDGEEPCIEITGDPEAEYVLGIDQNVSDSETADHFAMCLMKIVDKKGADGETRRIGMVVHQYAEVAVGLREHIEYLYYLISRFNIVYIGYDASQGKSLGFVNICNESELFKEKKIELKHIVADFNNGQYDDIIKQVHKGYSRGTNMIVQPQAFTSDFQRAANEYLQSCFDRQHIFFAGKARANGAVMASLRARDINRILSSHSSFTEILGTAGAQDEFIVQQDNLLDLVKKECALIEVKASALGNISYDIPSHMRRATKNRNRIRKDSYSALLLANWCLKVYLEAQNRPKNDTWSGFEPTLV